jgi:hypothetical protein
MNRGQKVVLGAVVVGGTALAISALSKRAEAAPPPPPPPPGQGSIAVSWLPAGLLPPYILIDGGVAGPFPVSVAPGAHTVSFGPIPPYTTPPDQVVQVVEGQTVQVVGTYIPPVSADVVLNVFTFRDVQPYEPGSSHIVDLTLTNPTNRTINYQVYAYPSDPGDVGEPIAIGVGWLGPIPPGTWGTQFSITMPAADGVYPVWLRFYEYIAGAPLAFIKRVNTGQYFTVGYPPPPPPPPEWPIVTQLASVLPYIPSDSGVWVYRNSVWLMYSPYVPEWVNTLQEIYPGEEVSIPVTQACTLTYGAKTWNLVAGWNTITW